MQCLGTCNITLQLGCIQHTVEAAVIKTLYGPLLSWHDSIRLGILPAEYPQQIRSLNGSEKDEDAEGSDEEHVDQVKLVSTAAVRARRPGAEERKDRQLAAPAPDSQRKIMQPPKWNPKTAGARDLSQSRVGRGNEGY